jgi:transcription elongation factor GreA
MTWLTQQTFDRLHAELEERRGPLRAEIVERISSARDEGDLKENGGYHAAKDEQGTNEARIRQLEEMLAGATTEPAADDQTVSAG